MFFENVKSENKIEHFWESIFEMYQKNNNVHTVEI